MNYNSLSSHLKQKFNKKVYKLALSAVTTCPNRDGTLGSRGCVFCSQLGSGDFAEPKCESITAQIENAKSRVAKKAGESAGYIAYFQSYTNTYAPIDYLQKTFFDAISHPDIVGLSVATRPDCLGAEVLSLLKELAKIKPVWVELGLQTIHKPSIDYIRRGYNNAVYETAVKQLHAIGCEVVTHVILGLPNEDTQMMVDTVKYCVNHKTDGIKLQLLHVLKNTDLAADYENGMFKTLEMDEYIKIVGECLKAIPPTVVIHRLTGDGAKRDLIAPTWSADKKRVLNALNSYIAKI